jgi:hypothetical protein
VSELGQAAGDAPEIRRGKGLTKPGEASQIGKAHRHVPRAREMSGGPVQTVHQAPRFDVAPGYHNGEPIIRHAKYRN